MRAIFTVFFMALAGLANADPSFWSRYWTETDFTKTVVDNWSEIRSGGVGKDGIPSVTAPPMRPLAETKDIPPREAVITVLLDGQTSRAYPLRYLMFHEIANDTIGSVPVAVTYCPLCNSAVVFDRRVGGQVLEFGVSGMLRNSDMVMYDRQSESWWQQATGEGIVGVMTGRELKRFPVWMESFETFAAAHPDGLVMGPPSRAPYGRNPYVGYDSSNWPFLYQGETPPHGVHPLARVVRVGESAWPLERLSKEERIAEEGVVLSWSKGQASAVDSTTLAAGREVGNVRVRDAKGKDVAHDVMFAFTFHAFWPKGTWHMGQ